MIDMKLPSKSKTLLSDVEPSQPEYPYGLSINLDNETLDKLGIGDLPEVGGEFTMKAIVRVKSVTDAQHEGEGRSRHVSMQIEQMDLGVSGGERKAEDLYPSMKP